MFNTASNHAIHFEVRTLSRNALLITLAVFPACSYKSYKIYNVHMHVSKTHGKSINVDDMLVDEEAREDMRKKIKSELNLMLSKRS